MNKTKKNIYIVIGIICLLIIIKNNLFNESNVYSENFDGSSLVSSSTNNYPIQITKIDSIKTINFRDPFLDKKVFLGESKIKTTISSFPSVKKNILPEKENYQRPNIRYKGIMNKKGEKSLAILSINSNVVFLEEGKFIDSILLKSITDTSIVVSIGKRVEIYRINK